MKAVDFINQNMNPITILEHYHFREISETDDSIRACCEIHKGNNPTAFMWNKSNNLWYCYTGDCHGGDVYTLVEKLEGVDFVTAVKRTAEILHLDITNMKIEKQTDLVKSNTMKWLQFMKNKNKNCIVTNFDRVYELPFTKYYDADDRFDRFDSTTLQYYQAQFAKTFPTEDGLLYNKLVIPIYFENTLRGVALRNITGQYQPKWMYQPKHILIREILYNYDNAIKTIKENKLTELILVEGIFDVWAYHNIGIDNVVAIFGSSLKKEQVEIILKTPIEILTLSFDNDDAGNKCKDEVLKTFKNKLEMKVLPLPKGHDPADCKPKDLLACYLQRR